MIDRWKFQFETPVGAAHWPKSAWTRKIEPSQPAQSNYVFSVEPSLQRQLTEAVERGVVCEDAARRVSASRDEAEANIGQTALLVIAIVDLCKSNHQSTADTSSC